MIARQLMIIIIIITIMITMIITRGLPEGVHPRELARGVPGDDEASSNHTFRLS